MLDEFNWGIEDFIAALVLIFGLAVGCMLTLKFTKKAKSRWILITLLIAAFLAIWAHLAVGLWN